MENYTDKSHRILQSCEQKKRKEPTKEDIYYASISSTQNNWPKVLFLIFTQTIQKAYINQLILPLPFINIYKVQLDITWQKKQPFPMIFPTTQNSFQKMHNFHNFYNFFGLRIYQLPQLTYK